MVSDINSVDKKPNAVHDDLVLKAARFGAFGWLAFFITLFALIVVIVIVLLKPKEVYAENNGTVVGQVIFGEAKLRADDTVYGDLKEFVRNCVSVNKTRIVEDLAVCVNHMTEDLADAKLLAWTNTGYITQIEEYGCERLETTFDSNKNKVYRDKDRITLYAEIYGEIICNDQSSKNPARQSFALAINGTLTRKTTNFPLGIKVSSTENL